MTRSEVASLAVAWACAGACASPGIAGGNVVARGAEPEGALQGRFTLSACRDERGEPLPTMDGVVRLLRAGDGRLFVVESRPGFDPVVVQNTVPSGAGHVFQLALKRASGAPTVREYRFPSDGAGAGRFAIVTDVLAWQDHAPGGGFVARYDRVAVQCALLPAPENRESAQNSAVPVAAAPAPAADAASPVSPH